MKIRSFSWGEANLSWSVVIEELLHACEQMGHEVCFISTNGTAGMKYWNDVKQAQALCLERDMLQSGTPFDIDITFTVPQNFPSRFLPSSKCKMAIYDYESSHMPDTWKNYYNLVDYVLPATNYVADMFSRNGCPENKIRVVPHGVDLNIFNPSVPPYKINTRKGFRFLCVAEPHYRKQLDKLLEVYCATFTEADDVSLILKTKLFKNGDNVKPFEMDLRPTLIALNKKYGKNIPEIRFITERLPNVASLYTACQAFVLMTASEGFGIPYLEAMACGLPIIAPRHGGQLDFLNDTNSILCETGTRLARSQEQYWGVHPKGKVGNPNAIVFGERMMDMYKNYSHIKKKLFSNMLNTAAEFTWARAAAKIINIAQPHI